MQHRKVRGALSNWHRKTQRAHHNKSRNKWPHPNIITQIIGSESVSTYSTHNNGPHPLMTSSPHPTPPFSPSHVAMEVKAGVSCMNCMIALNVICPVPAGEKPGAHFEPSSGWFAGMNCAENGGGRRNSKGYNCQVCCWVELRLKNGCELKQHTNKWNIQYRASIGTHKQLD